jgi:hypothetical protein
VEVSKRGEVTLSHPSTMLLWNLEEGYVRSGAGTVRLGAEETREYVRARFGVRGAWSSAS